MNPAFDKPELLLFNALGSSAEGYLTVAAAQQDIPFEIRRVFWTYFTPHHVTRGRHAHFKTEMVLVAVHGRITVSAELVSGQTFNFILEKPTQGLYLPPLCWHVMEYSHDAVQVVLASTAYEPADYIRNYEQFRELR
jgi:dTDP-4-dehydrorhamnose 3,5-epimerase-like enzyme